MITKKRITIGILAVSAMALALTIVIKNKDKSGTVVRKVKPSYGTIQISISATGTVLPQNRLEIKPAINGRVESVLVSEGQKVRIGQILAWMSSTERAALIDAARAQGAGSIKYWEDAYRPIPIVAPITGTVIVRSVEPGQTAVTTAPILVLSDRLIVKADVDETDIGRVREGQGVVIKLDAYPDVIVKGKVDLISYESRVVNNVTMYQVDIIPERVPTVYRSGMSADIDIIEKRKEHALLLPSIAVITENRSHYAWVVRKPGTKPVKIQIEVGISDDQNIEILSGIDEYDTIAVMAQTNIPLDKKQGTNPFMPAMRKGR